MCCEGTANCALVSALSNASNKDPFSPSITGTLLLDPNGDFDQDGMTNAAEDLAGTNPLVSNSPLRILSLTDDNLLTWSSVSGKTYRVWSTTNLATSFAPVSGIVTASGPTAAWLTPSSTNPTTFYRITALP